MVEMLSARKQKFLSTQGYQPRSKKLIKQMGIGGVFAQQQLVTGALALFSMSLFSMVECSSGKSRGIHQGCQAVFCAQAVGIET